MWSANAQSRERQHTLSMGIPCCRSLLEASTNSIECLLSLRVGKVLFLDRTGRKVVIPLYNGRILLFGDENIIEIDFDHLYSDFFASSESNDSSGRRQVWRAHYIFDSAPRCVCAALPFSPSSRTERASFCGVGVWSFDPLFSGS